MVVDIKRCVGCFACHMACKAEHNTPPGVFWSRVLEKEEGNFPTVSKTFLPIMCFHCQEPPCEDICPTRATKKEDNGIVSIDYDACIGCRACIMACPYQNRYYWGKPKDTTYFPDQSNPYELTATKEFQRAVVQKCDFCETRLDQGLEPACVVTCPAKARTFGDLDDPTSEISRLLKERKGFQLHSELGTDPSVYYIE